MAAGTRCSASAGNIMVLRICIIIPVYNEEVVIERNLETIIQYAQALPNKAAVVAVNDGSRDKSGAIILSMKERYPEEVFHALTYEVNRGYGGALKVGAAYAIEKDFDYVIFMDSDLTDHPKYFSALYEKMCEGWDYIKTTRHRMEGGYHDVPWKRRIISKLGCAFGKMITGLPLTDLANGFRAVKVDILRKIDLKEEKFPIIMEELIKAKRFTHKFCEISRVQGVRDDDARPSEFHYDFKTLWGYFRYLFLQL